VAVPEQEEEEDEVTAATNKHKADAIAAAAEDAAPEEEEEEEDEDEVTAAMNKHKAAPAEDGGERDKTETEVDGSLAAAEASAEEEAVAAVGEAGPAEGRKAEGNEEGKGGEEDEVDRLMHAYQDKAHALSGEEDQGTAAGGAPAATEEAAPAEKVMSTNLNLANVEELREVSEFAQSKLESRMSHLSTFLHGGGQSALRQFMNPHAKEKVDSAIGRWGKGNRGAKKAPAPAAVEEEAPPPEEEAGEAPPEEAVVAGVGPEPDVVTPAEESDEEALSLDAYSVRAEKMAKKKVEKEKEEATGAVEAAKKKKVEEAGEEEEEKEEEEAEEPELPEPEPEDPLEAYEQVYLKMIELSQKQRVEASKSRNHTEQKGRWQRGLKQVSAGPSLLGDRNSESEFDVEKAKASLSEQKVKLEAMKDSPAKNAAAAKVAEFEDQVEAQQAAGVKAGAEEAWRSAADDMRSQRALIQDLEVGTEEEGAAIERLHELEEDVAAKKSRAQDVGVVTNSLTHKTPARSRAAALAAKAAEAEAKLITMEESRLNEVIESGNAADDWHQKLRDRRLPEAKGGEKGDWTGDVIANRDEGDVPVYFKNIEDRLLQTQKNIVNEVRVRETTDLELDGSLQTVQERWDEKIKETTIDLQTATSKTTQAIHERFWQVQTRCLQTSFDGIYAFDLAANSKAVVDFADTFEPEVAQLSVQRQAMRDNFELKVQEKFNAVTSMLLSTRKDRLRVEDMMLTFLGKMCKGSILENDVTAKNVERKNAKRASGMAKNEAEKAFARALKAEAEVAAEVSELERWTASKTARQTLQVGGRGPATRLEWLGSWDISDLSMLTAWTLLTRRLPPAEDKPTPPPANPGETAKEACCVVLDRRIDVIDSKEAYHASMVELAEATKGMATVAGKKCLVAKMDQGGAKVQAMKSIQAAEMEAEDRHDEAFSHVWKAEHGLKAPLEGLKQAKLAQIESNKVMRAGSRKVWGKSKLTTGVGAEKRAEEARVVAAAEIYNIEIEAREAKRAEEEALAEGARQKAEAELAAAQKVAEEKARHDKMLAAAQKKAEKALEAATAAAGKAAATKAARSAQLAAASEGHGEVATAEKAASEAKSEAANVSRLAAIAKVDQDEAFSRQEAEVDAMVEGDDKKLAVAMLKTARLEATEVDLEREALLQEEKALALALDAIQPHREAEEAAKAVARAQIHRDAQIAKMEAMPEDGPERVEAEDELRALDTEVKHAQEMAARAQERKVAAEAATAVEEQRKALDEMPESTEKEEETANLAALEMALKEAKQAEIDGEESGMEKKAAEAAQEALDTHQSLVDSLNETLHAEFREIEAMPEGSSKEEAKLKHEENAVAFNEAKEELEGLHAEATEAKRVVTAGEEVRAKRAAEAVLTSPPPGGGLSSQQKASGVRGYLEEPDREEQDEEMSLADRWQSVPIW